MGALEWIPGGGHRGLAQNGGLPMVSLTEDSCLQYDNGPRVWKVTKNAFELKGSSQE